MKTRREALKQSAVVAGLLASTGLFTEQAFAYSTDAFHAKTVADTVKALGAGAPTESKDITITGPTSPKTARSCPWAPAPRCRA